jgi:transcriptional regulator with XRE-family HTH domain
VNENLRQALLRSRLRERDVATQLEVDPKTVRRWLEGRVPYPANRAALADLLNADEAQLWPEARGPLASANRPEELMAVYPHRWAIPRETWARFFASAEREIGILAYSSLFLAEDAGLLQIIGDKSRQGVKVRICLGAPNSPYVANRGVEEGIGDAMPAKVRNALALYRPLSESVNAEIKLHSTVLYNSIYLADDQVLVNQHVYGSPAAHSPVFHLSEGDPGAMARGYLESFCRVWESAVPIGTGSVKSRR